ncbi:hypothetical protein AA650_20815 [Anabaena sp. WA102]|uniref:PD-(D/E)XK nuclease family protein n=1 Tax=Anabaena sp. WA102 TaxID=1647413 RepID=UPI0006ABF029|nr:PD-(D/E)XK nuclease family protein [Anabaena sp. WA102]ALB42571.1 hypothetical protein AA650_20815 [Anabaena sp. WA102]
MLEQELEIEAIINELKVLPLFNLSLSSKELFHSNFLAWICGLYPEILSVVFADYLKHDVSSCKISNVYRESEKIDLTLKYSHGETLIIENKVKSLPDFEQLKEYSLKQPNVNFLLLSLIEPNLSSFLKKEKKIIIADKNKQFIWHYLSYYDLAQKLQEVQLEIAETNSYHGQLLAEYIQFIKLLYNLSSFFHIKEDENPIFHNKNIDKLWEIRFRDVIIKLWYSQLMQRLEQRLKVQNFEINENWNEIKKGQIIFGSGMINGKGFFEVKYCIKDKTYCPISDKQIGTPIFLGIQIDNRDFKILCECEFTDDKTKARKISEQLYSLKEGDKIWFDLSHVPGNAKEFPNRKGKEFNQYYGTFIYRYKGLKEDILVNDLINLIVKYIFLIKNNQEDIEAMIEKAW